MSPTSQAQGTYETRGQHMKFPKYKSNSKVGIFPLPHTPQMKSVAVFLPWKGHSCQAQAHRLPFTPTSAVSPDEMAPRRAVRLQSS